LSTIFISKFVTQKEKQLKLSKEIKTGILVIVGILLFIFGYHFLKGTNLLAKSTSYYVVYNNVAGLSSSAPVTINGLQVGQVQSIDFIGSDGKLVVEFTIDKEFSFSKKSIVQIYSSGFIGGNNLGIIPDYTHPQRAMPGDTLSGEIQEGMIDGLVNKLDPLEQSILTTLSRLDTVLLSVSEVLDKNTKNSLRSSINGLDKTIASLNTATASISTLLQNNKDKLDNTLINFSKTSANLAEVSSSLTEIEIEALTEKIRLTADQLAIITQGIENGEGSVGKLLKDDHLYNNLSGASKQLEELLRDMKENPKRYVHFSLFGKKAKSYQEVSPN